jgi:hypothetical protein
MSETIYSERLLDWMMDWWLMLPLTVTMGHKNRFVRLVGIPWMLIWFLPTGIPFLILAGPVLFTIIGESTWKKRI